MAARDDDMNDTEAASVPETGAILEALPLGIAVTDTAGRIVLANAAFRTTVGLRPGIGPARVASVARAAGADLRSEDLPGGGRVLTLAPAEDDAARRIRALHAILEAIPHGICVYGPDHRLTMFNRTYTEVMSDAPLAIGDHRLDIIRRRAAAGEYGPGDPERITAQQAAFDVVGLQVRRRRRPNGTVIDVRTASLPDGGFVSVVTDLTPLTRAEDELSRRSEVMAAMVAAIRHGIILWGADRRLVACNAAVSEFMNHPPGLLEPGRSEDEVIEDMLRRGEFGEGPEAQETANHLLGLDRTIPYTRTLRLRTGRILDLRSDPVPRGGWLTTYSDVTEARQAEEELRRAKAAAEAANQAKSRFLATMSHELRTPLNAVIGFSDALLREATNPAPARVAEFARQINESGRNLLGLINIILDVARIESGRFDLAADIVDITRLLRAAVRQADTAAQAAEIVLAFELAPDLPKLRADERRLAQVMRHLLSNAVKFTEIGGTVTIGARRDEGGVLIFVRDNGIGIREEDIERVFEPFTQLDSTLSRRYQGSGLGLYVSRALVAGHGGRLTLKSRAGEGTTAEIHLPASRVLEDGDG